MFEFDWTWFKIFHENETRGKFKAGDTVKYEGSTYKVLACNFGVGGGEEVSNEYLLEGFPYLVWEEELQEVLS
jgi:hypothetical protein